MDMIKQKRLEHSFSPLHPQAMTPSKILRSEAINFEKFCRKCIDLKIKVYKTKEKIL